MSTPGRTGTKGPKPGLKDRAIDWLRDKGGATWESFRESWGDFRATSIYFQLKTLVLLLYVGLVAITVFVVPLGEASNDIGARIIVLDGDMVVGRYFVITNASRSHWRDVRVEIDGGYAVERDLVPAGGQLELFSSSFKKKEMRRRRDREIAKWVKAPLDAPLTELRVSTESGEAVAEIPPVGATRESGLNALF